MNENVIIIIKMSDCFEMTKTLLCAIYFLNTTNAVFISENLYCKFSDVITNNKNGVTEYVFDPNALYPELPPNHPKIARFTNIQRSKCPVENGVIKTKYVDFI